MKSVKYVAVLSGGLDSSVATAKVHEEGEVVLALTFVYGQPSGEREVELASKFCQHYGIEHKVIHLDWLENMGGLSSGSFPEVKEEELGEETAKAVWVPNRNMVLIAIAASFAEALGADVVVGFNAEEAETFPDNSKEFVERMNAALQLSTMGNVKLYAPLVEKDKVEIIKLGSSLGVPFQYTWSCYGGGEEPCWKCESCIRRRRAFEKAGVEDPWRRR
jgi:7-cyano-7-deazaguanine synthase